MAGGEAPAAYERTVGTDSDALAARCRGLLAADDAFDSPFLQALEQHPDHDPFDLARIRLCFGERRRRAGRRIDARDQLREAHYDFERLAPGHGRSARLPSFEQPASGSGGARH